MQTTTTQIIVEFGWWLKPFVARIERKTSFEKREPQSPSRSPKCKPNIGKKRLPLAPQARRGGRKTDQ